MVLNTKKTAVFHQMLYLSWGMCMFIWHHDVCAWNITLSINISQHPPVRSKLLTFEIQINDGVLGLFFQADAGDNEAKVMTKLAPEWVRSSDPLIRSPARYRWTTAPALRLDF